MSGAPVSDARPDRAGAATLRPCIANSLPKSGTHLLARVLELLGYRERPIIGSALPVRRKTLRSRVRRALYAPFPRSYILDIDIPVRVGRWQIDRQLRRLQPGEFWQCHLGHEGDLLRAIERRGYAPVLNIRDPRAVLVSWVRYVVSSDDHLLHNAFAPLSEEQRYVAALEGGRFEGLRLESLRARCERALEPWFASDSVCVVRFEDLVGAQGGGSTEAQHDAIARLAEHVGAPREAVADTAERAFGGTTTFRKGQIEAWRDELPASILPAVEAELADVLEAWGYA